LRLTAGLLRDVPLPLDATLWQQSAAALSIGDLPAYAESATAMYRAAPEVTRWWLTEVSAIPSAKSRLGRARGGR
jgi:hypothetical protein